MKKPTLMEEMTVKEAGQAIKDGRVILLPVGICEQHGFHLPLSTDIHNAVEISHRASAESGAVVAPVLNYVFSGGTLPGTINISPPVVSLMIGEILTSLSQQGFKKIIIVPGHGGTENEQAIKDGIDFFLRKRLPDKSVTVALFLFWKLSENFKKAFAEKDFHAGYMETSLMLYWHPELVKEPVVLDEPEILAMMRRDQDAYQVKEKPVDDEAVFPYISQHPKIKVGVMGYPERASAELGRKICEEAVGELVRLIQRLMEVNDGKE
ncbi:MAG: creatininase family protein [Candidatus Omnitrophota bacterium]